MTDKDAAELSARQLAKLDLTLHYIRSFQGDLPAQGVDVNVNAHMNNIFGMDPTLLEITKLWDYYRTHFSEVPPLPQDLVDALDKLTSRKRVESEVIYG